MAKLKVKSIISFTCYAQPSSSWYVIVFDFHTFKVNHFWHFAHRTIWLSNVYGRPQVQYSSMVTSLGSHLLISAEFWDWGKVLNSLASKQCGRCERICCESYVTSLALFPIAALYAFAMLKTPQSIPPSCCCTGSMCTLSLLFTANWLP